MSLLDQIAAGPEVDEAEPLRVYADQLILGGDSFGELIVVAAERLAHDTPELRRREAALTEEHARRIRDAIGRVRDTMWRRGFVDHVRIDVGGEDDFGLLANLAAEPALRLVRRMMWDARMFAGAGALGPAFAELARLAPRFPRLVELSVRRFDDRPADLQDVSVLYAAYPRLELLELGGRSAQLGDIVLPELRTLIAPRLEADDAKRITAARLPKLEHLELGFWSGSSNLAATFGPLLHRDFGPQLATLALAMPTMEAQRWLIGELPHCPLARGVKRLGFAWADLDDAMLARLIADAPAWHRLERLAVPESGVSVPRLNELLGAFGGRLALV